VEPGHRFDLREADIADAVAQEPGAPLPVDARVVLARGVDRSVVGIAVVAQQPVPEVEVNVGGGRQQRQLWQGAPPTPGAVMLREDDTGPGPAAIPVQVASAAGTRDYTLFLPVMARLGESAAAAPVGRLEGETLSELLARFSALTGLVILAEEPLSATVTGEIPPGPPRVSLEQIAAGAGLQMEQGNELAVTLTQRRSPQ
jgi:hypothetical protein